MKRYIVWIAAALAAAASLVAIAAHHSGKTAGEQNASFTVEFHNGEQQYVINGYETVTLSDVFANLGIESDGEISKVTFSDPSLIAVAEEAGDWSLKSLAPFSTHENLRIAYADGRILNMEVTDGIPIGVTWKDGNQPAGIKASFNVVFVGDRRITIKFYDENNNYLGECTSNDVVTMGGWYSIESPDGRYWFEDIGYDDVTEGSYPSGFLDEVTQPSIHTGVVGAYNPLVFWKVCTISVKCHSTAIKNGVGYNVKYKSEFILGGKPLDERTVKVFIDGEKDAEVKKYFPARDETGNYAKLSSSDLINTYDSNLYASCTVSVDESTKTYTVNLVTKYSVKFNGNGSTSGSMSNQNFVWGTAQNLTANAFKKEYTVTYDAQGGTCGTASAVSSFPFTKWATNADGTGDQYTDKQSVNNLTKTTNAVVNLYAQWGDQVAVTLPSATKTGYVFTGWYTAATGGTKVGDAGDTYKPTGDVTLYGQWRLDTFDLTIKETGLNVRDDIKENDSIIVTVTASGSTKPAYVVSLDPANPSVTIKAVPAGTYNIVETGWSYAYTVEQASFETVLDQDREVTFVHTPKENTPAHDESSKINWKN